MTRNLVVLVALTLSLVLGGCLDLAPAYKQDLLAFDEGLVGTWVAEAVKEKDGVKTVERFPVKVEKREAKVTAGRLGEYNPAADGGKPEAKPTPAYRVTVSWEEQGAVRSKAYEAVLLRVEGAAFMAYQLTADDPALKENLGDVLPVHKIVRVERGEGVITVRGMKRDVVWLPRIRPLSGESGGVRLPEAEGMWFVSDPDRLVEVLRLAARDPGCWDEGVSLKRE